MPQNSQQVRLEREGSVARIRLDRPGTRNALDQDMIEALLDRFRTAESDESARVIVLEGAGPVFCAGADIAWMREEGRRSHADNLQSARRLAILLEQVDLCSKPVIVAVQGAALGGGIGLVAVGDIVVTERECRFALPEVQLGILPAVVAPFVVAKIGEARARDLFLTGRPFEGPQAVSWGLATRLVDASGLGCEVERAVEQLLRAPPDALAGTKRLVHACRKRTARELRGFTSGAIAEARASESGQEGLAAFLEKRPARWREDEDRTECDDRDA